MKWNINYLQTICNLACVLIPTLMVLRVKDVSLYDTMKERTLKQESGDLGEDLSPGLLH